MTLDLDALDPTVNHKSALAKAIERAPRPRSLDGLVVGLLDNRKEQGAIILETFGEALRKRHGAARVVVQRKDHYSKNAPDDLLDAMAEEVDVAVVGLGG